MGQAVDGEGDRRGDDVVDLNAGVVTERGDEEEQRGIFGDGDHQSAPAMSLMRWASGTKSATAISSS